MRVLVLPIALFLIIGLVNPARADEPKPQQLASVEELKTEAFKALRGGKFDIGNDLLTRAASISNDPQLARMAGWTSQFAQQRQVFATERHASFEKAVVNVHKLIEHGKNDYALDFVGEAFNLTADKVGFRAEKWVDDLVNSAIPRADRYEADGQWIKALRIYSDLASIEPAKPIWKDRLKSAARRVRLLAMYAPESLKAIQDADSKDRDEVDALVAVDGKKPASRPTSESADDSFKLDWRDTLRDIKYTMLREAMIDARTNYYREVSYKQLMIGGITALQTFGTTPGMEQTFPGLIDAGKKKEFLDKLDAQLQVAKNATPENEKLLMSNLLARLKSINEDTVRLDETVVAFEFADGALAGLDPFSTMIWPNELSDFTSTTSGEFSGVGVQIMSDEEGNIKVQTPIEDSPAYKAGIRVGDLITHIDGKNARGITTNQAMKTIRGPVGTPVALTIKSPDGSSRQYRIIRDTIKVASVKGYLHKPGGGWEYLVDPDNKIGYCRITQFTRTTGEELGKAVAELKADGARAVIMDLRHNPGGLLSEAQAVSDKFLKEGVIVSTRADRETPNPPNVLSAKVDDDDCNLPMVVLVNQYSASASEIVSGALKDQKRAILVGERTFGKGSVQMLFPLSGKTSALKLTTSHYYLPSGKCIHREENSQEWGVDPDVTIEMTRDQMRDAINARAELDVLHDVNEAHAASTTGPVKKDLLTADPQLSAAVLVLRLQLAGAAPCKTNGSSIRMDGTLPDSPPVTLPGHSSAIVPRWFLADVLFPFLVTRLLLTLIGLFGITRMSDQLQVDRFQGSTSERLNLWCRWDARWYLQIARQGYSYSQTEQSNTAFAPLFPMLMRTGGALFQPGNAGYLITGLLVSNLALLIGLGYLCALGRDLLDVASAQRACWYVLVCPGTLFLSAVYPMSLMFAIGTASMYYALKGRWALAGLIAALAPLTRPDGVLIAIPLWVEMIRQRRSGRIMVDPPSGFLADAIRIGVYLLPIGLALGGWLLFLYLQFGDPLVFVHAQSRWVSTALWTSSHPERAAIIRVVAFVFSLLILFSWRKLPASLAVFGTIFLAVILFAGRFWSIIRFLVILFPAFLVLGELGKRKLVHYGYLALSSILASLLMLRFALGFWVG